MSKILTNSQFQIRLKQENPFVHTNTQYVNPSTILNCFCDHGHHWEASARNVLWNKTGCPYCSGRKAIVGETDMWTTRPDVAQLLEDPKDGFLYKSGSRKKVGFICPNCGACSKHIISNVSKRGLSCPNCSDGISYPNKFMYNLLKELNIDFVPEFRYENSSYRYDFYIPEHNIIVEMHGRQHYVEWEKFGQTLEEIQQNDINKYNFAKKQNVFHYIVIDCYYSDCKYVSKSILNSKLNEIFNLKDINFDKIHSNAISSRIKMTAQYYNNGFTVDHIASEMIVSTTTVRNWLKTATELNLCNYIPSKGFLNDKKLVLCVTTNEVFQSLAEASRAYNVSFQNISKNCYGKRKYAGTLNGEPLVWKFV